MGERGADAASGPQPMQDIGLGPLAPVVHEITVGGETLTIKPAGLVTLAEMVRALGPMMRVLEGAQSDQPIGDVLMPALFDPDSARGLLQAAALGSGRPLEWVGGLPGDEQFALIVKVIEVNLDFFDRRLRAQVSSGLITLVGRLLAGQT